MVVLIKILEKIFLPPGIFLIFLCVSFFYLRKMVLPRVLIGTTIVLFYFLSIAPGVYVLNRSLEATYDQEKSISPPQEHDMIVVLASGASSKERSFQELSGTSWKRLWRGIELYYAFDKKIPILYTGDAGKLFDEDIQEPALAKRYAERAGISGDSFLIDNDSGTTHESALNVKKIIQNRFQGTADVSVYLITSARHMERSVQAFRRNDMIVIPVPADFVTSNTLDFNIFSFFPDSENFNLSMGALHELIGRVGYQFYTKIP